MGLYVYGAMLMIFSFIIGIGHSPWLVAFAISSAALAALAEVFTELAKATGSSSFRLFNVIFAPASWVVTAWTTIFALYITIGGV